MSIVINFILFIENIGGDNSIYLCDGFEINCIIINVPSDYTDCTRVSTHFKLFFFKFKWHD